MDPANRSICEQGRSWGVAWIDAAVMRLGGPVAAGGLSEAQEDGIVSAFQAALLERCAELIRVGEPLGAVEGYARSATVGAGGRCKELAARAAAANEA